ncbi:MULTISPECIES: hypothetical protein [unclassified Thiocapsa]|uniref:hypothetical protein n=1 Tax=unclassified Thiocapsa TaxID=2641286 RepID=UPI0035B0CC51
MTPAQCFDDVEQLPEAVEVTATRLWTQYARWLSEQPAPKAESPLERLVRDTPTLRELAVEAMRRLDQAIAAPSSPQAWALIGGAQAVWIHIGNAEGADPFAQTENPAIALAKASHQEDNACREIVQAYYKAHRDEFNDKFGRHSKEVAANRITELNLVPYPRSTIRRWLQNQ